jgi:hypothetical protein
VTYHLTTKQLSALRRMSRRTGLAVADLVRRAVESYLKENAKGNR